MPRLFLLIALLLPPGAHATSSMEDAFHAYVKVRQAEERLATIEAEAQNQPEEAAAKKLALQATLTDARIAFQGVLRSDQAELTGWEKEVLDRVEKKKPAKSLPEAGPFLAAHFPKAKNFSALEWLVVQEWFGRETQEKFLRESFAMEEISATRSLASVPAVEPAPVPVEKIIWILDPYRKILTSTDSPEKTELTKLGHEIETMELSAFSNVEDQAEELRHFLISKGDQPYILASTGEASAVVNKMLDLHPSFRGREGLLGWINMNGRLFGKTSKTSGRSIASMSMSRADKFAEESLIGLKLLHLESLERQPPLGRGFPIVNLVSTEEKFRPAGNLREALASEGQNRFVKKGPAWKAIREALPLLKQAAN